jgi:hypothetical protein
MFPVKIPAGTRISARSQASTGASVVRCSVILFSQGFLPGQPLGIVTTYGAVTADSGGTSIDPGGSANTLGSYVEITATTTYPIRYLAIAIGNQKNGTRSSQSWLVDISVGPATETVLISRLALNCSTSPDSVMPQVFNMMPVNIPAGTRITVRAQSDGIDATDRLFDVVLYGVT